MTETNKIKHLQMWKGESWQMFILFYNSEDSMDSIIPLSKSLASINDSAVSGSLTWGIA